MVHMAYWQSRNRVRDVENKLTITKGERVGETNWEIGIDILIDRVPEELWTEVCNIVQEAVIKTISKKNKCKKGKMAVWWSLTNIWEKKRSERQGEKERYTHLNAEFQRIARREEKAFLSDQFKEIEENNRMGKTEIFSRKLEIPREHFMQRWAQ